MEITVKKEGNVSLVGLKGRVDLASGAELKEQIKSLFDKEQGLIHMNFAEVEFINSSGLGALVSIMKEVRVRKGRLTLSNLAAYVQEIFEITQLSHIFELFDTQEEALASYQVINAG